jgi:transposase
LALVDLSVVEQRYRAVLAVQTAVPVVEEAAEAGVSRQSVHTWVRRYRADGLADRRALAWGDVEPEQGIEPWTCS